MAGTASTRKATAFAGPAIEKLAMNCQTGAAIKTESGGGVWAK